MTHRVIIEAPAQADMQEAYRWIAQESSERAARWYNGLVDVITSLAMLPERCPFAPENAFFPEDIRQLLYGKRSGVYRILLTVAEDTVHVLHVRHGARRPLRPKKPPSRKLH
ncbi:MAG TPA: type II toxin-antitoxin system RelE/ParE family toxin [Candidatus Binatia bacterium]|nr:type II toxin-antitoxin system RelE/ParE family toxin [Candidatus Binatia bacterium]